MITYEIDGANFSTLEEFFAEFRRVVTPEWDFPSPNLDGFNDVLRGGFGTPPEGFRLRWKNHDLSRKRLGYPETVRQLELRLGHCHPDNRGTVSRTLKLANTGAGPTVFDWLIEIIGNHTAGGQEEEDNVELVLD